LRTRQAVATTGTFARSEVPTLAVLLDARPLASGDAAYPGLPTGGVSIGASRGPSSWSWISRFGNAI